MSRGRVRQANVVGGRPARHEVRVSAHEEAALLAAAAAAGVSVPRLLVESALAERGETVTERRQLAAELFGAFRVLSGVANNVNQIAKVANSTGELVEQTSAVLAAVERATVRVDRLLEELAGR